MAVFLKNVKNPKVPVWVFLCTRSNTPLVLLNLHDFGPVVAQTAKRSSPLFYRGNTSVCNLVLPLYCYNGLPKWLIFEES